MDLREPSQGYSGHPVGGSKSRARPFLKWAGGKTWFTRIIPSLVPRDSHRYFEPFLGSGSAFFALLPANAKLSDSNPDLIETFREVRDHPEEVIEVLEQFPYEEDFYYGIRSAALETAAQRAARVIYLNRCCWNGLYRVNRLGQFNVPFGSRATPPLVCDAPAIRAASVALKDAALKTIDFESAIDDAGNGDFVFADPPYTVTHGNNGFVKYNETIFSWGDQIRLHDALVGAQERGALFLVSNADHPSIRRLYGRFRLQTLSRHSVIAANSDFRRPVTELIITNYQK